MANETDTQQNSSESQQTTASDVKQVKGYRKKGLVSEKVLLERLSDMSIEDNLLNPMITLSSVEDDENTPMEQESPKVQHKNPLKQSLSLDVPVLNIANEAQRPPL